LQALNVEDVLERFASDKKHTRGCYTLILVSASGEVVLEQIRRTAELQTGIRVAVETTIGTYTR
jgi:3-dehydroquinate synthase